MNTPVKFGFAFALAGTAAAVFCLGALAKDARKSDTRTQKSLSTVTTNDSGVVCKTQVTTTLTTNGTMVTEHRRETRICTDASGNVIETSTSDFAETYGTTDVRGKSVGRKGPGPLQQCVESAGTGVDVSLNSFLGLEFGKVFATTNTTACEEYPTLVCAKFTPKRPLDGFTDYYVYLTPQSHQVVKVCACAKNAVEGEGDNRRHYLVEALERKYGVRARAYYRRQGFFSLEFTSCYSIDVTPTRSIFICLDGASNDYATVITASDEELMQTAAAEYRLLQDEQRKKRNARRSGKIKAATDAF